MHQFQIIIRSIRKNFVYTWTNVLGLSIAFCFVFLTAIYVVHEYTFDKSFTESERIHRLVLNNESTLESRDSHPFILVNGYEETFPAMESVVRAYSNAYVSDLVRIKSDWNKAFDETDFWHVEHEFLQMFDVTLLEGSTDMFDVPGTILISESVKNKLFKNGDAVGEYLVIGNKEYSIIGVYKDFPTNASMDPRFIISLNTMKADEDYQAYFKGSGYLMFKVFVSLATGSDKNIVEQQLEDANSSEEEFFSDFQIALEPLVDYHFGDGSPVKAYRPKVDEQLMTWLIVISACLLAVAIANFGNVSLAIALGRTKEVAIQKVIGARKLHLIQNTLTQSLGLGVLAFIVGLVLIELLMPVYGQFVQRELNVQKYGLWPYLSLFMFASAIGVIAGIYPSFIISNFKVSHLFNSFNGASKPQALVRKGLLAFQFLIAFGLISTMLFMNRQLTFMMSKEPGYDYENTIVLRSNWFQGGDESRIKTFKEKLMAMPEVLDITLSDEHPMKALDPRNLQRAGFKDGWEKVSLLEVGIDCHFFDFYNIATTFDQEIVSLFCTDSKVAMLNNTALNTLENEPIGKLLPAYYGKAKPGLIVQDGVVSDVHLNSVRDAIPAMLFRPLAFSNGRTHYSIKYADGINLGKLIQTLQEMWWEEEPMEPFCLKDLEEEHNRLYSSEQKMMQMTSILGVGVCIIAFAGVFAMSIFYGRERLKEVSIRKVLGAGVFQLFGLQNRVFLIVMIISFAVAIPLVWLVVDHWIAQFAYRTNQPLWLYAVSALVMVLATILSSGWYSLKVAKVNPSEILRDS
ncbi:ABC transporter permease [Roseivirga pacifica]